MQTGTNSEPSHHPNHPDGLQANPLPFPAPGQRNRQALQDGVPKRHGNPQAPRRRKYSLAGSRM